VSGRFIGGGAESVSSSNWWRDQLVKCYYRNQCSRVPGPLNMVTQYYYFWADATNSTLTFRDVSLNTGSTDGHLDNVRVEWAGPALSIRVSHVELCWYSQTNQIYQVQYRSALTTNTWTDLGAPIQGNSPTNCICDAVAPGTPQRFYQVLRLEPVR
jgi:hypothetical protein